MSKRRSLRTGLFISFLEYVIAILVLLDCNTPYSRSATVDYHIPELIAFFSVVLFIFLINRIKVKKSKTRKIGIYFFFYYIAVIILFLLSVDKSSPVAFLARFGIMFPLFTIIQIVCQSRGEPSRLLLKYSNIVFVIAVISLFFWLFGSNLHVISPTAHVKVNWGNDFLYPSYYGLYFERQFDSFLFYNGNRNMGIFCEAPMFSVNLIIAVAIETFLKPRNVTNKKRGKQLFKYIILIITLLSTITTTGYLALIMIFIAKYVVEKPRDLQVRIIKYFTAIFVAILGLRVGYTLFIDKSDSISWLVRLDDFNAGIKAWRMSPIWGNGYGDEIVLKSFMSSFRSWNMGYSNSIFTVLSQGGILLFSIYAVPMIWCAIGAIKHKNLLLPCFEGIVILEFVVTIFPYTFIMLILVSFLLANCFETNKKKANRSISWTRRTNRHEE